MSVSIPNLGALTTTLTAASQLKVILLADPTLNMIAVQPASGVSAVLSPEGTDGLATRPTNGFDVAVNDYPIPRDSSTGAKVTAVYLWSAAGGSVNINQYAREGT